MENGQWPGKQGSQQPQWPSGHNIWGGHRWAGPYSIHWLCVEVLLQVFQPMEEPVLPDLYHPLWHPNSLLLGLLLCLYSLLSHLGHHAKHPVPEDWSEHCKKNDHHLYRSLYWAVLCILWKTLLSLPEVEDYGQSYRNVWTWTEFEITGQFIWLKVIWNTNSSFFLNLSSKSLIK